MTLPRLVPLFPLPNAALFPGMPLPLHVFEPRYCKLVRDALDGHRTIGMVLLRPGWQADYEGRPPVFPVGCAGSIGRCEALDDGRFEIVLHGQSRFRIVEEHSGEPYRLASVDWLTEEAGGHASSLDELRRRVVEVLSSTLDGSTLVLQHELPHDVFVNALCQSLPLDPLEQQVLLDAPGPLARYERLGELLEFRRLERSQGGPTGSVH